MEDHGKNYPDVRLKLEFMIVEDSLDEQERENNADYKELRNVRDFVSHPECKFPRVYNFISVKLPSAVSPPPGKKVKFRIDDPEHMVFVRKYQGKAREWAKKIFEAEVIKQGGRIS